MKRSAAGNYKLDRIGLLTLVLTVFCCFDVRGQFRSAPDKDSAHILSITEKKPDPKIQIESITGAPGKSSLVTNHGRTYKAFILCVPGPAAANGCNARVFFTNLTSGKTLMISGEEAYVERARPVGDLKWLDNDRLSYERWMGPHFGHRYVVNVARRKQVEAYIISDNRK